MDLELLHLGEGGDDGFGLFEGSFVVLDVAGTAHEVGDLQAAKETPGAGGRQGVRRAGRKVAEGGGRVMADEHGAGGSDA